MLSTINARFSKHCNIENLQSRNTNNKSKIFGKFTSSGGTSPKKNGPMEKFCVVGASLSFILFAVITRLSEFSVYNLVNIQNTFVETIFLQTSGMNTVQSMAVLLSPFVFVFIAFLFLIAGFSFLSSYGYYRNQRNMSLISSVIGAVAIIILFNVSIISMFIAAGLVISSVYVMPLANTYSKELKKWVLFRTGSNSIGKALLVFNIILAVGIFAAVYANIGVYSTNFKSDMNEVVSSVALSSIPDYQMMTNEMREKVNAQVESSINNSELFNAYFRWLPATSAVSIWIILEFLKGIFFSNIGGIFTKVFIKLMKNLD